SLLRSGLSVGLPGLKLPWSSESVLAPVALVALVAGRHECHGSLAHGLPGAGTVYGADDLGFRRLHGSLRRLRGSGLSRRSRLLRSPNNSGEKKGIRNKKWSLAHNEGYAPLRCIVTAHRDRRC